MGQVYLSSCSVLLCFALPAQIRFRLYSNGTARTGSMLWDALTLLLSVLFRYVTFQYLISSCFVQVRYVIDPFPWFAPCAVPRLSRLSRYGVSRLLWGCMAQRSGIDIMVFIQW